MNTGSINWELVPRKYLMVLNILDTEGQWWADLAPKVGIHQTSKFESNLLMTTLNRSLATSTLPSSEDFLQAMWACA